MAKICSYCREIIDDNCTTCPNCKKELGETLDINRKNPNHNKNAKAILTSGLVAIFLVIAVVYSIIKFVYEPVKTSADDSSKLYHIHDSFNCANFTYTIEDVKYKYNGEEMKSLDNNTITDPEWVIIIMKIKNRTKDYKSMNISDYDLYNSSGRIIYHGFYNDKIDNYSRLLDSKLKPNEEKTGYIQYINDETNNSNLRMQIKCDNMFKNEYYTIDLRN